MKSLRIITRLTSDSSFISSSWFFFLDLPSHNSQSSASIPIALCGRVPGFFLSFSCFSLYPNLNPNLVAPKMKVLLSSVILHIFEAIFDYSRISVYQYAFRAATLFLYRAFYKSYFMFIVFFPVEIIDFINPRF